MSTNAIEIRLAHLEGAFEQVDKRLGAIEGRLDTIDGRFRDMDGRFGDLDRKIDAVFFRLVALMLGTWATLMLAVLSLRHA